MGVLEVASMAPLILQRPCWGRALGVGLDLFELRKYENCAKRAEVPDPCIGNALVCTQGYVSGWPTI